MSRKSRWFWVLLFVWTVLLLGTLATGWNMVLVQDYRKLVDFAHAHAINEDQAAPLMAVTLGTLGFLGALTGMILFFVKLLREMRLNQLQSDFLATITHELKTPIATLELTSSMLRAGGDLTAEETRELWASHAAELTRLREEVETLLEAARMQNLRTGLKKNAVILETWLGESLERWRKILGPGSVLRREGDPLHCEALLDLKMLNLITDNLLDNARKFSRDVPNVVIRSRLIPPGRLFARQARWQLRIEDNGWGFEPADSGRIFKRFVRARTEAPAAIPGTGLGLFLARTASKAIGVSLRGESAGRGHGAIFTLEGHA